MRKAVGFAVVMLILAMTGAAFAADGGHLSDVVKVTVPVQTVPPATATAILGSIAPAAPLAEVASPSIPAPTDAELKSNLAASFPAAEKLDVAVLNEVSGSAGENVVKLDTVAQFSTPDFKFFLRTTSGGTTELPYAGAGLVVSSVGARTVTSIPANSYAFVDENGNNASSYPTAASSYLVVNVPEGQPGDLDPVIGDGVISLQPILATASAASGGSGGGCNAGFAASAVLILLSAGFALSRKRTL